MRIAFMSLVMVLIGAAGCGDRDSREGKDESSKGDGGGLLHDIDLARPTPEELGDGWDYALGRKGPNSHGRTVNDGYKNEKTGEYVKLVISKQQSVSEAVALFERKITGFTSPPYSGLGEEARVEPRGSRRRPYVVVTFRRRNVVVSLHQDGRTPKAVMDVARIIDNKIKSNLH